MKRLLLALALFATLARAADERPKEYYDPDVQRMLKVTCFAFGPVGFVGGTSEGEAAFAQIVRKKEVIRYILACFEHGAVHARCYALVALRESSPSFFRAAIAAMRKNPPKKITTMSGCVISEEEPEKILAAIESGAYAGYFKQHEEKG